MKLKPELGLRTKLVSFIREPAPVRRYREHEEAVTHQVRHAIELLEARGGVVTTLGKEDGELERNLLSSTLTMALVQESTVYLAELPATNKKRYDPFNPAGLLFGGLSDVVEGKSPVRSNPLSIASEGLLREWTQRLVVLEKIIPAFCTFLDTVSAQQVFRNYWETPDYINDYFIYYSSQEIFGRQILTPDFNYDHKLLVALSRLSRWHMSDLSPDYLGFAFIDEVQKKTARLRERYSKAT